MSMELTIKNLSKTYKNGVKALDNVSLTIPRGMYGLLGAERRRQIHPDADAGHPAGAGQRQRHAGGHRRPQAKGRSSSRLGYLPQEFGVYPRISAQDMFSHLALLKGITNSRERKEVVSAMLQRCNLYDVRKKALPAFPEACDSALALLRRSRQSAIADRG